MGDPTDKVNINNVFRQIDALQQAAAQKQAEAYRSQDGKGNVNEGLLKQGRAFQKQAEELIEQYIVPIVQSLNPSQVAGALAAAGASPQFIQQVSTGLNAARNVAKVGMTVVEICETIQWVVPVLIVITAGAILALLCSMWHDRNTKKEGERMLKQYEDRAGSGHRHVPFQGRIIPGRL